MDLHQERQQPETYTDTVPMFLCLFSRVQCYLRWVRSLPTLQAWKAQVSKSKWVFPCCWSEGTNYTNRTRKKVLSAVQVLQVSLPVWLWELLVQLHLLAMCRACVEHPWEWWHQESLWQPCGSPCHSRPCRRPCRRLCHRPCHKVCHRPWLCRPCHPCRCPRCPRCPRTFPGSSQLPQRPQRLQRPPHRPPTARTSEVRLRAPFFLVKKESPNNCDSTS